MIFHVYKPLGKTSFEATEGFPKPITFAGRLDPMAEGVLVLLSGEDRYKKEEYLKLDKEYEAEILFGFETDTHDILGLPNRYLLTELVNIEEEIKKLKGEWELPFPAYSSYKIKGKPLFRWAREGRLDEIQIPMQKNKVLLTELVKVEKVGAEELLQTITERINLVKKDLRQEEVKQGWKNLLENDARRYQVVTARFHVASGTYIRSLAHMLGKNFGTGAILFRLIRTRVGGVTEHDAVRIT